MLETIGYYSKSNKRIRILKKKERKSGKSPSLTPNGTDPKWR